MGDRLFALSAKNSIIAELNVDHGIVNSKPQTSVTINFQGPDDPFVFHFLHVDRHAAINEKVQNKRAIDCAIKIAEDFHSLLTHSLISN